jgi:hypothetical protein
MSAPDGLAELHTHLGGRFERFLERNEMRLASFSLARSPFTFRWTPPGA